MLRLKRWSDCVLGLIRKTRAVADLSRRAAKSTREGRRFREPSTTGCAVLDNLPPVTFLSKKRPGKFGAFLFLGKLFYSPGVEEISVVFIHGNNVPQEPIYGKVSKFMGDFFHIRVRTLRSG